jgi:hypothetical protein
MNGMEMMLKSMGIDPAKIQETMAALLNLANSVDTRLSAIENRLTAIETALSIPAPVDVPAIPLNAVTQTNEVQNG